MGWIYNFRMTTRPLRRKLRNFLLRARNLSELQKKFANDNRPRFILMLTPTHGNLGDHAIVLGELKLLKELYSDMQVVEVPKLIYDACKEDLKELIAPQDIILIQGGGFFGSLYPEEHAARREIAEFYHENKVICFPVSIYYAAGTRGQEILQMDKRIFSSSPQLTIMVRDEISYALAKKEFANTEVLLTPDCAMGLVADSFIPVKERDGVVFVWRRDMEKVASGNVLSDLIDKLPKPTKYEVIDNVSKKKYDAKTRAAAVYKQLSKIGAAKVVVTDRFHGVVFAVITRTPVIAFPSLDTKITSGIKWFRDLSYVHLVDGPQEAGQLLKIYLSGLFNPDGVIGKNKKRILLESLRKALGKEQDK